MISRRFVALAIGFLFFICAFPLYAQTQGVVSARLANVREKPTTRSEVLMRLRKGQKLQVLSQRGKWYKVRVKVDANFTFDGWMSKKVVKVKKASSSRSRRSSGKVAPPPRRVSPPARRTPPRRSTTIAQERQKFDGGRGEVSLSLGYQIYNYSVETGGAAPSKLFSYNLPGIGGEARAKYWFMQVMDGKVHLGGTFGLNYTMYKHTTNLMFTNNTTTDLSTSHTSYDMKGAFLAKYLLRSGVFDSVSLGLGFEYFKFSADDVESDTGPIGLYTSQTMSSLYADLSARLFFGGLTADLGADVLFLNFASESPDGTTGSDPSGGIGFVPKIQFGYQLGGHHNVSLGYSLKMQSTSFSGAGSRVGSSLTDGSISVKSHQLTAGYYYSF